MNKNQLKHFKRVLKRIENGIDTSDTVKLAIKQRLKRITKEVEFCVNVSLDDDYLSLQQFRILMDKIINVIHLRDDRAEYMEYLDTLKEYEEIKAERAYLSRNKISYTELNDRKKFLKKKLKDIKIDINNIHDYKYKKFQYWIGYLCNDSSRVIHDDNCTYVRKVDRILLNEIEQIVLFFTANIFISFCENRRDKEYLRNIHKANKKKIKENSSITKKNMKQLKKELRGVS